MNTTRADTTRDIDPVENILKTAEPRPAPPVGHEQSIRDAVREEWRSVVAARTSARRRRYAAAAASVLVAVVAVFAALRPLPPRAVEVATIQKSTGIVYSVGEGSTVGDLADRSELRAGQLIETGTDSALGLRWHGGGSLRLDERTRLEFLDATTVYLHRGRIYFDSEPAAGTSRLVVQTGLGALSHRGTQYMADATDDRLTVTVREGRVSIDGRYYDETAVEGKQVQFTGSSRPVVVDVAAHSPAWNWVEAVSPGITLDQQSAYDFLRWVGRETGYRIVFDNPEAEAIARDAELAGRVEADPRTELRYRMLTTDLSYRFDAEEGRIHIGLGTDAVR